MISAVVLTRNDEAVLARCLESLLWCDEVVTVDDNSTDGTVAVAKKYGAKVFTHALNNDFAAQRNFGMKKAEGEWVLFVDSDEVVSEELKKEVNQTVNGKRQTVKGYFIRRKDFWGGKWLTQGETANVRILRLGRKDAGKWEQPVHEEWKIVGVVGTLVHPLLHYPHQNVAQFLEKVNRYSTFYARHLHSQGVREPAWHIVVKPTAKFFVNYLWRLGFLDGTAGMAHALIMSLHSFLVRGKLWQLHDA